LVLSELRIMPHRPCAARGAKYEGRAPTAAHRWAVRAHMRIRANSRKHAGTCHRMRARWHVRSNESIGRNSRTDDAYV
jgi:hypothetical protein